MCGISGIYNYLEKSIDAKSILEKIVKLQHTRGPDDQGIWISKCKKISFGHNRLAIIDLTKNGRQPFISKDGDLVITFNGEIYNFKEIKKELSAKNIFFKSNTDTEVILESYKYWGIDFLKRLRGMFAFAMWDLKKRKLILARDPFGIKPLYFSKKNGICYFASQVKSLLSINDIDTNYSDAGLVSFYLWGNIQEPYTLYKNIKSIKKGSCLIIKEDGSEETYNFANIKSAILNSNSLNFKNTKDQSFALKEIINETVNFHQVSDTPITVLLSSGIDSNVILSSISNKFHDNCSALTVDFKYKGKKDEVILAKKSALMNNFNHNVAEIPNDEIIPLLKNFFKNMDLPTNDGFNNYLVSHFAKQNNSKVIISGIGGDELFAGYPSFRIIPKLTKSINYLPDIKFINNFFKKIVYRFLKKNFLKTKYSGVYEYGRNINSAFMLIRSTFLPFEIKELISQNIFKNGFEELDPFENLKKDIEDISNDRLSIMYLEIEYYLCNKLLRDADWTSMAHSVELRTPFVDWVFFNKLIPILKSNININKKSLLNCVKKQVPDDLYRRKKTGFEIPHAEYLKKLSIKRKFPNPIRDWTISSHIKYLENNPL